MKQKQGLGWTRVACVVAAWLVSGSACAQDWLPADPPEVPAFVTSEDRLFTQGHWPAGALATTWIRVTADVGRAAGASDVRITVAPYREKTRLAGLTPDSCRPLADASRWRCEVVAWLPEGTERLTVTAYADAPGVEFHAMNVEHSRRDVLANHATSAAFDRGFAALRARYYRGNEVDWEGLRQRANQALMRAPSDIDPTVALMAWVFHQLPGREHLRLMRTPIAETQTAGDPVASAPGLRAPYPPPAMPSCRAIRPGAWQIQLPPTLPLTPHQQATYVATAQRCLLRTPAPSVWVLDLRGNTGGSDEVMLAAAAPLLRSGPVYQWVNAQGETLVVTLGPDGKRTGGVLAQRRALPLNQRHPSRVIAWVDGACGSACEMLAVALQTLPAHLRVGSSTAGLTSANELVPLTDRVQMAITAGWMLDAQGAAVRGPLQPDVPLAVQTAEDLLLSLPK